MISGNAWIAEYIRKKLFIIILAWGLVISHCDRGKVRAKGLELLVNSRTGKKKKKKNLGAMVSVQRRQRTGSYSFYIKVL